MENERVDELTAELSAIGAERLVLERRFDARLANLQEFDLIKVQTIRRTLQQTRARRAAMQEKTQAVLRDISDAEGKVRNAGKSEQAARLDKARVKFREHVERMYPLWQDQVERENIRKVRLLEKYKDEIQRRRELATQAFEKERALRTLVAEKEHDVYLLRQQEKSERLRRERERIRLEAHGRARAAQSFKAAQEAEQRDEALFSILGEIQSPHVDLGQLDNSNKINRNPGTQQGEEKSEINSSGRHSPIRSPILFKASSLNRTLSDEENQSITVDESPNVFNSARLSPQSVLGTSTSDLIPPKPTLQPENEPNERESGESFPPLPPRPMSPHSPYSSRSAGLEPGLQLPSYPEKPAHLRSPKSASTKGESSPRAPTLLVVKPDSPPTADLQHFVLQYDWKTVPLGASLPDQAEQKLSDGESLGRMARIPFSWTMTVWFEDELQSVHIPVTKNLTIGDVIERVRNFVPDISSSLTLLCDEQKLDPDDSVGMYGDWLFQGEIRAKTERQKKSIPSTADSKGALDLLDMKSETDTQDWSGMLQTLGALLDLIEDQDSYRDVRGSKYGILGAEEYSYQEKSKILRDAMDGILSSSTAVDISCQCVKLLLKQQATGLLPISQFTESGSITKRIRNGEEPTAREIAVEISRYHDVCNDGRAAFWSRLVRHWQWLVQERLLSRDEVASVFLPELLSPGDKEDSSSGQTMRYTIRELSSTNISLGENSPSDQPTSNSQPRQELVLEDESDESEEESSPARPKTPVKVHRPNFAMKSFDEDDDEDIQGVSFPPQASSMIKPQPSSGSLAQFLAANKPPSGAPSEMETEDIEDDEFDF